MATTAFVLRACRCMGLVLLATTLLAACGGGGSSPVPATPPAPAITMQPADRTVTAGQDASFTVAATGVALAYQWQRSTDAGATFADEPGALGATLELPAVPQSHDSHLFRVRIGNAAGSVTSDAARLRVNAAPVVPADVAPAFTTQPASITVPAGQAAQFTVAVIGTPAPVLQWQVSTDAGASWGDIGGETGLVLSLPSPAAGDSGRQFRALATSSAGSAASHIATLTVTAPSALAIQTTSPLPTAVIGQAYGVTLQAAGGTPPYRWAGPAAGVLEAYGLALASSGQISGTPTAQVQISFFAEVYDSSAPEQSATRELVLRVEAPCPFGSVTVQDAPNTVQGKFCAMANNPPADMGGGTFNASWSETSPNVFESISVVFDGASGQVAQVSFGLSDPLRLWTYSCVAVATQDFPACTGVTVNPALRTVDFSDTLVGSGSATPFRLTGRLDY